MTTSINLVAAKAQKQEGMSTAALNATLDQLLALPAENEWVEFKEARASFDLHELSKYFAALANEANLHGQPCAWLVFGVRDNRHKIIGSRFCDTPATLQLLKQEIAAALLPAPAFINIHEIHRPEGRVLLFQIAPAPCGKPIAMRGHYYGRDGESLVTLSADKMARFRQQLQQDHSC